MLGTGKRAITVEATVNLPVEKAWKLWTVPEHIMRWNNASDDWHTPRAENDLRVGGHFLWRMEAKDGSFGFDFGGVFDEVKANELIVYTIGDGRKVRVTFAGKGNQTLVKEVFEAEETNSIELQKNGWQAILDNFKSTLKDHHNKEVPVKNGLSQSQIHVRLSEVEACQGSVFHPSTRPPKESGLAQSDGYIKTESK